MCIPADGQSRQRWSRCLNLDADRFSMTWRDDDGGSQKPLKKHYHWCKKLSTRRSIPERKRRNKIDMHSGADGAAGWKNGGTMKDEERCCVRERQSYRI
jgi:hypothetical protein